MTNTILLGLHASDSELALLRKAPDPAPEAPRIDEAESRRRNLLETLPQPYRRLYEKLTVARSGTAVARVMDKNCGGCHMIFPPQFLTNMRAPGVITQCPSCHRLLALDPR